MGMKTQWPERDGQDLKTVPGSQTTGLSIPLCDLEQLTRCPLPQFPHPGKEANDKKLAIMGLIGSTGRAPCTVPAGVRGTTHVSF